MDSVGFVSRTAPYTAHIIQNAAVTVPLTSLIIYGLYHAHMLLLQEHFASLIVVPEPYAFIYWIISPPAFGQLFTP